MRQRVIWCTGRTIICYLIAAIIIAVAGKSLRQYDQEAEIEQYGSHKLAECVPYRTLEEVKLNFPNCTFTSERKNADICYIEKRSTCSANGIVYTVDYELLIYYYFHAKFNTALDKIAITLTVVFAFLFTLLVPVREGYYLYRDYRSTSPLDYTDFAINSLPAPVPSATTGVPDV